MRRGSKHGLLLVVAAAIVLGGGCSRTDQPQSAASDTPILIEPRVAVGRIHAGMSARDVIQQFGEPNRRTANAIEYTPLGFAVMPDKDGIVQVVMCGDVTGINGPLVNRFNGRTKEGIGLKSTREDLIKAYGEPTSSEKLRGGTESISYDSLGMTFTLESGRIYHMIVRLEPAREKLTDVTLEPVQNGAGK